MGCGDVSYEVRDRRVWFSYNCVAGRDGMVSFEGQRYIEIAEGNWPVFRSNFRGGVGDDNSPIFLEVGGDLVMRNELYPRDNG